MPLREAADADASFSPVLINTQSHLCDVAEVSILILVVLEHQNATRILLPAATDNPVDQTDGTRGPRCGNVCYLLSNILFTI